MGRLTAIILARFRVWDMASQIGFVTAIILFVVAVIVGSTGTEKLRQPATIGAIGLIFAAQGIFMWANRSMVTPFTKAQRFYLDENFEAARDILEDLRAADKADLRALTLLGNTYRQLGKLSISESILSEVVDNHPEHHFPLYGFGRTLLVQGRYTQAGDLIEQALANGAPPTIHYDVGEARFRQGDYEAAGKHLREALLHIQAEPHRVVMAMYLLHRLEGELLPADDLVQTGLDYWQTQAQLFASTPYGQALADDLRVLTEGDRS